MSHKKIFYFDVETTGIDERVYDIIQLAGIIEIDGEVKEEFNILSRPFPDEFEVEEGATLAHGFTKEQISDFPSSKEAHRKLIMSLSKYVDRYNKFDKFSICGYNVDFDVKFLYNFFNKCDDKYFGSWFNWNLIDPIRILKYLVGNKLISMPSLRLENVCSHFGIDFDAKEAHDALYDIKKTRELKLKIDKFFEENHVIEEYK